jgi:hypothetical protein
MSSAAGRCGIDDYLIQQISQTGQSFHWHHNTRSYNGDGCGGLFVCESVGGIGPNVGKRDRGNRTGDIHVYAPRDPGFGDQIGVDHRWLRWLRWLSCWLRGHGYSSEGCEYWMISFKFRSRNRWIDQHFGLPDVRRATNGASRDKGTLRSGENRAKWARRRTA